MKTKKYKYRPKGGGVARWTTQQHPSKREVQAKRDRENDRALKDILSCGSLALRLLLKSGKKPQLARYISFEPRCEVDHAAAERHLETILDAPQGQFIGGIGMDTLDRKIIDAFPGKVVRKDLTALMKKGANVPTYVLEYLLGMYCTTDDEEAIQIGMEKIKRILSENYVRPDQSEYVKSKIKENGQYTIIDKITVELDEREDKYIARFTNLKISPFEVESDLVVHHEKLLIGGIWCIIQIEYVGLEPEEGQDSCYISSEMIMSPCSFDREEKYGVSLRGKTIQEVWESPQFDAFRRSLKHSCPDCPDREYCMGGCPLVPDIALCRRVHKQQLYAE